MMNRLISKSIINQSINEFVAALLEMGFLGPAAILTFYNCWHQMFQKKVHWHCPSLVRIELKNTVVFLSIRSGSYSCPWLVSEALIDWLIDLNNDLLVAWWNNWLWCQSSIKLQEELVLLSINSYSVPSTYMTYHWHKYSPTHRYTHTHTSTFIYRHICPNFN